MQMDYKDIEASQRLLLLAYHEERKLLWKRLPLRMADVHYQRISIPDEWQEALVEQIEPQMKATFIMKNNKVFEERRRVMVFGEEDQEYVYATHTRKATPWDMAPILYEIRRTVRDCCLDMYPNMPLPDLCIVNWYRSGSDRLGKHSDKETHLRPDLPIISLSLGVARRFVFYNKRTNRLAAEMLLGHGMLCMMGAGCQENYTHTVPSMAGVGKKERWSLTWRFTK
jgi:alkylated DNA repair dioxygenase AlkB